METLDILILLTAVLGLVFIAVGMARATKGSAAAAKGGAPEEEAEGAAGAADEIGREDAIGLRQRGQRAAADPAESENEDTDGDVGAGAAVEEDDLDFDEENRVDANGNPLTKKDLKKLLKKKEKRDAKRVRGQPPAPPAAADARSLGASPQMQTEARQYKEERLSKREQAYQQKIAEREAARLAREEAEREEAEEKARKEQEAYEQWSNMFEVEQEGTEEAESGGGGQDKLAEFISFIERKKVVVLEELAHEFGLRTQDAIARVEELQASGRLQGVTDDRGKFIHVTEEEMDKVAAFLRSRGRVSITQLARESSQLVRLKGEEEEEDVEALLKAEGGAGAAGQASTDAA